MYDCPVGSAWYNGSQPTIAKPVKTLQLHDPKIQFDIHVINCNIWSISPSTALQLITILQMSAAAVSIAVTLLMLIGLLMVCMSHLTVYQLNYYFHVSIGVTLIRKYQ